MTKFKIDTDKLKANIARAIEENPILVMGVVAAVLTGGAAAVDANTKRRNSKTARKNADTWELEVNRRNRAMYR
jgi:hypothetical protein